MSEQSLVQAELPNEATPASMLAYVEDAVRRTEEAIATLEYNLQHERNALVHVIAIRDAVRLSALRQTN